MRVDLVGVVTVFGPLGLAIYSAYRLAGPWGATLVLGLSLWGMAWESRRED